jgi:hypothetical protein
MEAGVPKSRLRRLHSAEGTADPAESSPAFASAAACLGCCSADGRRCSAHGRRASPRCTRAPLPRSSATSLPSSPAVNMRQRRPLFQETTALHVGWWVIRSMRAQHSSLGREAPSPSRGNIASKRCLIGNVDTSPCRTPSGQFAHEEVQKLQCADRTQCAERALCRGVMDVVRACCAFCTSSSVS